jgi:hypothetical protein
MAVYTTMHDDNRQHEMIETITSEHITSFNTEHDDHEYSSKHDDSGPTTKLLLLLCRKDDEDQHDHTTKQ